MILSGKEIVRHMGEEIIIDPFDPERGNPNSYNLTLADDTVALCETVPGNRKRSLLGKLKVIQV